MRRLCAADQPRRASADTEFRDRLRRGFAQTGIVRQAEVIVGGKIDEPFADDFHFGALRAPDLAQFSVQRSCPERLQLLLEKIVHWIR